MTKHISERRKFTRFQFNAAAQIFTGEQTVNASLRDISLKGALIKLDAMNDWQPTQGNYCELVVCLKNGKKIYMHSQIAHIADNTMIGLECEHMDALSIKLLHDLIEETTEDISLLEREMKSLWMVVSEKK